MVHRYRVSKKLLTIVGLGLMVGLSLLLMGCSQAASDQVAPEAQANSTTQGQSLPITAEATIGGQKVQLEVAQTPEEQAMGLMYRSSLADDRGMLFPFRPARPVQFWMKNVTIPLDMVFLNDGVVRYVAADVPGCAADPCPTYGPRVLIDQVIELRGGRAAELGIRVGDRIPIQFLNP